jgi:hypothetical protein
MKTYIASKTRPLSTIRFTFTMSSVTPCLSQKTSGNLCFRISVRLWQGSYLNSMAAQTTPDEADIPSVPK